MTRGLDLFAGAGGWDLAADALGLEVDGVEIMPEARATRDAAGLSTVHDDVWTLPAPALGDYDGLIASPPCQTFSAAGKGSGRKALDDVLRVVPHVANVSRSRLRKIGAAFGDDRTALVLSPLWYALNMPDVRWLAWEQVRAVLPVWEACAEVLRAHGWHVWTGNVTTERYGVPQVRVRAVLIASRDHPVGEPVATHSRFYATAPERRDPGVADWVSMSDGLGWGMAERPAPTITGGGTETGGGEPIAKLYRYTDRPDWTDRPAAMVAAGITGAGTPRSVDHPAPTVTGKGTAYWLADADDYRRGRLADMPDWTRERPATTVQGDPRIAAPGHWCMKPDCHPGRPVESMFDRAVRLTPAEAGVLQSFPADYPWQGNKGKRYLQAGNAVPPLLARAVLAEALGINAAAREPVDLFDLLASVA